MQTKTSTDLLELIEAEMKELRQIEALEAQIREMAAGRRERVMGLWKKALGGQSIGGQSIGGQSIGGQSVSTPTVAEAAAGKPETNGTGSTGASAAGKTAEKVTMRPFGSPGAPRDLLAENGSTAKVPAGNGASALVNGDVLKRAPSAQQVFQSLNRLVGGSKNEPLTN